MLHCSLSVDYEPPPCSSGACLMVDAAVRAQVRRCTQLLDLIDGHVIATLSTFSTPVDEPLERLRKALDELSGMADRPAAVGHTAWFDQVRDCRVQLAALAARIPALGSAAEAAGCALYYLGGELKTLAENNRLSADKIRAEAA